MIKNRRFAVAATAFILVISLLLPSGVSALSGFEELERKELVLNDFMDLSSSSFYNSSADRRLSENYLLYRPKRGEVTPLVAYGRDVYEALGLTLVFDMEEEAGRTIVAASNGDFFSVATGVPIGVGIKDGAIRTSEHSTYESIGFDAEGKARIGRVGLSINMTGTNMDVSFMKLIFNKVLTDNNGVVLYSSYFGPTNEVNLPSRNVILKIDDSALGGGKTVPNARIEATVAESRSSSSPLPLEPGYFVLSISEATPYATALSALNSMKPGDKVAFDFTVAPGWEDTENALGGGERLIADGRNVAPSKPERAPRTALGIRSDGSVIVYTADGRRPEHSSGLTLTELADRLLELGCKSAINLDGGGSTMLMGYYPGHDREELFNTVSESRTRRCGNYLLFINNMSKSGGVDKLYLYPYQQRVLAGSLLPFAVKATDSNYHAVRSPSGTTFGLSSSSLGEVDSSGVFRAGTSAVSGSVTASYGRAKGSAKVEVVAKPDVVTIVSAKTGTASPDAMSIQAGEIYEFSAEAVYRNLPLYSTPEAYRWTLEGDIGSVDETGRFTATISGSGNGVLTVSAGGRTDSVNIKIVTEGECIADFEDASALPFPLGPFGYLATSLESSLLYVHNGYRSLKLEYDLPAAVPAPAEPGLPESAAPAEPDSAESIDAGVLHSFPINRSFRGKSPTMLSLWVYGDGSGNSLEFALETAEGVKIVPLGILDHRGWKLHSVQLPAGVSAIRSLGLRVPSAKASKGTIYMDHLMAGFGYYLDTAGPVISAEVSEGVLYGEIIDDVDVDLKASKISVTFDGESLEFTFDPGSGSLRASLPEDDGLLHRISIVAEDKSGNISRAGISVEPSEEAAEAAARAPVFSDMKGHWASDYSEYLYDRGIILGRISKDKRLFDPDNRITREEFSAMMVRWLGTDTEEYEDLKLTFKDSSKIQSWAVPSVKAAYALGLMTGKSVKGDIYFDPAGPITRQEAMTVIGRMQKKGYEEAELDFRDAGKVDSWALPYVKTLVRQGVISGMDGKLEPLGQVTRGQVAKMIFSLN